MVHEKQNRTKNTKTSQKESTDVPQAKTFYNQDDWKLKSKNR